MYEPGKKINIKYSEKQDPFPAVVLTFREAQQITALDEEKFPDRISAFEAIEACLNQTPNINGEDVQRLLSQASLPQVQFVLRCLAGNLTEDEEKKFVSPR